MKFLTNNRFIISICFIILLGNSIVFTQTNDIDMILDSIKDKRKREIFPVFHSLHKKDYHITSEEGAKRYKIFKANMKWVKEKNTELGKEVYGITPFMDITDEEFKKHYLMSPKEMERHLGDFSKYPKRVNSLEKEFNLRDTLNLGATASLDWRYLFQNNPTKDQKTCGACWSFSTNSAIEANFKLKFGEDKNLSVQYLLDCDFNDSGCAG
jgi:C1A family cysteine protease